MKKPNATELKAYLMSYLEKCSDFEKTKQKGRSLDYYGVIENGGFKEQEAKALNSAEAYWAVREQVRQYQKNNEISGIVWEEVTYRGKGVRVPSIDDQLISVPGDKEILIAATPEILNWWAEVTEGMDLWRSIPSDDKRVPINLEQILVSAPLAEYAEVYLWDSPATTIVCAETGERWLEPTLEINLQLCWGIPENVPYVNHSESGSEWFSATRQNLKY